MKTLKEFFAKTNWPAKVREIEQRIAGEIERMNYLRAERETLALAASENDAAAVKRISQIDVELSHGTAHVETLRSALSDACRRVEAAKRAAAAKAERERLAAIEEACENLLIIDAEADDYMGKLGLALAKRRAAINELTPLVGSDITARLTRRHNEHVAGAFHGLEPYFEFPHIRNILRAPLAQLDGGLLPGAVVADAEEVDEVLA